MTEIISIPGVVQAKDSMTTPFGRVRKGQAYQDDDLLVVSAPEAFEPYRVEVHSSPEPEPEPDPEPAPEPIDDSARPKGNASVAEWAAYVGSFGEDLNAEFLNGLKRDDLIAMADDFEAAAAAEESNGGDPDAGDD